MDHKDEIEESQVGVSVGTLLKSIAALGGVILLGAVVVTKLENEFSFSLTQWAALALLLVGDVLCAIKLDEKLLSRAIKNPKHSENLSIGICTLIASGVLYLFWELF